MTSTTPAKTVTIEDSPARYNAAVKRARTAIVQQARANWTLGDLALTIESVYGESTIKRFADDLGINPKTMYDLRAVAEAYPADDRGDASWTVHQIFMREDDRADLVAEPRTTADARKEVADRKDGGAEKTIDEKIAAVAAY